MRYFFYLPSVTAPSLIRESLIAACASRGVQAEISKAFDVHPSTVKRWIEGGDIPSPMLKLLDLYFFGTIPFEIANEKTIHGVLDFTDDQWRVIEILARRESTTPGKWIANQIRSYLSYNEEARHLQKPGAPTLSSLPDPVSKVANDLANYKTNGGNG